MTLDEIIETRTAQLLAITEDERDSGDTDNPVLNAEYGPTRVAVMNLFFDDTDAGDGVTIEEDLSLNDIVVKYFANGQERELTSGALYEWALNYYRENW